MEIPVFIFTGFLDSGKTTLLRDTLESDDFKSYRTLIIRCEEGDEEFDESWLKENHAFICDLYRQEELTDKFLAECQKCYDPLQIMIEYNGTWPLSQFLDRKLPRKWQIGGIYSTVDCTTVDSFLVDMRQMFMEQFSQSQLIIFNRCSEEMDRGRLRRIFKAFNPAAQIIFEREDGEMFDPADEPLPYDIEADVIRVEDVDFGIWYLDAMDHPDRYKGRTVQFLGQVYRGRNLPQNTFVPGRFIMTCCANDIRFMGYICHYNGVLPYKQRDWVTVTVKVDCVFNPEYGEEEPVLTLVSSERAEKPEQDPVYFN